MSGQSDRSKLRTTDVPKNWCIYYHRPLWNDKLLNPKLPNICIVSRPIQRLKNNLSPTNIHNESNQEIELMNQESQKHKGIRSFHNDGYFFLIVVVSILTPQCEILAEWPSGRHTPLRQGFVWLSARSWMTCVDPRRNLSEAGQMCHFCMLF